MFPSLARSYAVSESQFDEAERTGRIGIRDAILYPGASAHVSLTIIGDDTKRELVGVVTDGDDPNESIGDIVIEGVTRA